MIYRICVENIYQGIVELEIVNTSGYSLYFWIEKGHLPSFELYRGRVYSWDEDKGIVEDITMSEMVKAEKKYDELLKRE